MPSHRWSNRLFPPLIVGVVVGSVWYAAAYRTDTQPVAITASATPTPLHKIQAATTPTVEPLPTPTIQKLRGKVQLSVDTKKVVNVQKVEFYVGNQLVGAAYGAPFTVSIDENSLQTGNHQVVAKVYTPDATTQTPAASFSTDATTPVAAPKTTTPQPGAASTPVTPTTPAPATAPTPDAPTNLTAVVGSDGSVTLSWDAPTNTSAALNYEVWRGGVRLATTADASYTDTTVSSGQSYSYQVVAIDNASGQVSSPSDSCAVDTPPAQGAGSQPQGSPDSSGV